MAFRNIIFSAVVVGLVAGSLYGVFQQLKINPIIHAAERYEVVEETAERNHAGHSHNHSHEAWGPEDGMERILFTMGSNALVGISFAVVLISLMALHNLKSTKPNVNLVRGVGWGIAAMATLFISPALFGLHPEVPGTNAAALEHRQIWWLFCVIFTATGIFVLYYLPLKFKVLGVISILLPHLIGAPHPDQLSFANTDPAAVNALTELSNQFLTMTTMGMLVFYSLLGALAGYMTNRFVNLQAQSR